MTTMVLDQCTSAPSEASHGSANILQVRREDIYFHTIAPGILHITFKVTNTGQRTSPITEARLQAAAFGAFLPWTDIGTVKIPSIPAGESVRVAKYVPEPEVFNPHRDEAQAPRSRPSEMQPTFNRADDSAKDVGQRRRGLAKLLRFVNPRRHRSRGRQAVAPMEDQKLPERHHWMGNINVLIGEQAVERHLSGPLRLISGARNEALFFVGNYEPDHYRFDIEATEEGWNVQLALLRSLASLPFGVWQQWHECGIVTATIDVAEGAKTGHVGIKVTQRSTNRSAVVEFDLDVNAMRPGCYKV